MKIVDKIGQNPYLDETFIFFLLPLDYDIKDNVHSTVSLVGFLVILSSSSNVDALLCSD